VKAVANVGHALRKQQRHQGMDPGGALDSSGKKKRDQRLLNWKAKPDCSQQWEAM
jgi:hypothetical protein